MTLTADNGVVTTETLDVIVRTTPILTGPAPAEVALGDPVEVTWTADASPAATRPLHPPTRAPAPVPGDVRP